MSRFRKFAERAFEKLDEHNERSQQKRAREAHARRARALRHVGGARGGVAAGQDDRGARRPAAHRQGPPGTRRRGHPRRHQGAEAARPRSRTPPPGSSRPRRSSPPATRPGLPTSRPSAPRFGSRRVGATGRLPARGGPRLPRLERAGRPARPGLRRLPRPRHDRGRADQAVRHRATSSGTSSTPPRRARARPTRRPRSRSQGDQEPRRPPGRRQPSPLDEDIGLDLLLRAGIDPSPDDRHRPRRHLRVPRGRRGHAARRLFGMVRASTSSPPATPRPPPRSSRPHRPRRPGPSRRSRTRPSI